ncbi:MAG TPA: hypothetical protein IGS52_05425 [Oscillatoriaceae cyanobacterium M33_DOE_052]|uniref:Methyl-accepting transducer domain-containing protein n=1 Tax=Planktothricoides sp. SpSt-374 TaxID=2282167 RepID=A0A7C3ZKB1_9CYAN|nr:hypothetical protein [Oscillatoriaceae cyanobacterium M33_DOE_052]
MIKKLRTRIWLAYAVVLPICLVMAGLMYSNVTLAQQALQAAISDKEMVVVTERLALGLVQAQEAAISFIMAPQPEFSRNYEQGISLYQASAAQLKKIGSAPEQKEPIENIIQLGAQVEKVTENWMLQERKKNPKARIKDWLTSPSRNLAVKLNQQIETLKTKLELISQDQEAEVKAAMQRLLRTLVVGTVVFLVWLVGLGVWVAKQIGAEIQEIVNAIASSSTEIAATVDQQEHTTAVQSKSVNQTSVTIEQLSASSQQAAAQAEVAALKAAEVLALVDSTATDREIVRQAILQGSRTAIYPGFGNHSDSSMMVMGGQPTYSLKEIMKGISQQVVLLSQQTNQIANISILATELASQTNMLALNAAVEAVRAGENGKGFGVVAAEIRKLAEQSKLSAKKISDIVVEIQTATNASVAVSTTGTQTVERIILAMDEVALANQQISLNAKEQKAAIEHIAGIMNELSLSAAQIATGIAQCKISTQQLNSIAKDLQAMV